jgi:hypothetical protein
MNYLKNITNYVVNQYHNTNNNGPNENSSNANNEANPPSSALRVGVSTLFNGVGSVVANLSSYLSYTHIQPEENNSSLKTHTLTLDSLNLDNLSEEEQFTLAIQQSLTLETEKNNKGLSNKSSKEPQLKVAIQPSQEPNEEEQLNLAIKESERIAALESQGKDGADFKIFLQKFFNIHEIKDDGNCCLYSLVYAQNEGLFEMDSETRNDMEKFLAGSLRTQVVDHLRINKEAYEPFCTFVRDPSIGDGNNEIEVNFEKYLEIMNKDGIFLGTQELQAFSEISQRPIIIYKPANMYVDNQGQERPNINFCFGINFIDCAQKPIYLYHKNNNHYELLTLKEGITNLPLPGNPLEN